MKRIKKLASLLLAMAMVLGMTITSFAAEGNYVLTIETVKGHTYKIYQLATGDVSKDGTKLSNIQVGYNAKDNINVDDIKALVNLSGAELGKEAEALVDTTGNPIASVEGGADGGSKTATLAGGYYVILDSYTPVTNSDGSVTQPTDPADQTDSLSRVMVTLVQDTTMIPKDTTIAPDKKIIDDVDGDGDTEEVETNEAAIGDIITYKLSGLIPDMQDFTSFKYVFVDTMSKGLTPNVTVNQELKGLVGTDEAIFKVTAVDTDTETGISTVRVALLNAIDYKDQKGAIVQVQITATLNQHAVVAPQDNPNKLKIDFSNDSNYSYDGEPDFGTDPEEPKGTTPEVTVTTYTTQLDITKIIGGTNNILQGAEFQLESTNGAKVGFVTGQEYVEDESGTWYKLVDGAYTETEPTTETENAYASTTTKYRLKNIEKPITIPNNTTAKAFVNADGKVVFTGLGVGDYKLTEVTTPDGYNTMADVTFTITWTKENGFRVINLTGMGEGSITVGGVDAESGEGVGDTLATRIPNFSGSLLPSTGGIGTTIFYVVGGILVIGAGILLVAKKRMSSK
ncbi:MAG: isopeptide-forming domain-containing fimbrial protein [Lachnospiraceae bacterium]|jgi:fimbrial isopeptide formation D2 family protein/LPXTG-motif cell wall-anchored protein|nr:isopeptide-forming domain-containing fimbrial protein [Lachnospiraceae bacterium]